MEILEEKKKEKIRYDKELLEKVLERDGATLVGEYEKLNRDSKINFLCKCGKENKKNLRVINNNGGAFCYDCCIINRKEKQINTNRKKYNCDSPAQSEIIKKKKEKTMIERYGVINPSQNSEIQKKKKEKFIANYGVDNPSKSDNIKTKKKVTCKKNFGVDFPLQSSDIKNKIKNTNINKYGVDNPSKSECVKTKKKDTCKKNFGVEHPSQSEIIRKNMEEKNIIKYGVKCVLQNEEIKEKIKQTNLEKYGVEYNTQNLDIFEKQQKNAKKFKEFKMPSGEIRKVQGYEPFALTELLKTYTEEKIKTDRKEVGRIQYEVDGKKRYYFPDIYLPDEKKFIEVKSTWTAKQNPELIEKKKQACIDQGYACEIWVYDAKGERVVC
jgi:hypothetical protein